MPMASSRWNSAAVMVLPILRKRCWRRFRCGSLVDCRHALRGLVECLDFDQILSVCIAKICPCLGVDSRGSHGKDRLGDVVRAKSASQNSGGLNSFDDTSTNVPIMGDTKRANLRIALAMAVEQYKIDYSIVTLRGRNTFRPRHRHPSHEQDVRKHLS